MARRGSLKRRIIDRVVSATNADVFLSRDFADLGIPQAVSRALRELVSSGDLVKLGYGVYARSRPSLLTGEPMLAVPGGFAAAAREALDRLGVKWQPSQIEVDFLAGRSNQFPANGAVSIKGRFARRIADRDMELARER